MIEAIWAERADADAVAGHVARVLERPAVAALPGGGTPVPILEAAARGSPSWAGARLFPTDDRIVPPGHAASNLGMLRRTLGATGAEIVPLAEGMTPPRFDLVWIGMGEDGHVASLFPSAIDDLPDAPGVVRTTPDPLPPQAPYERLTLTLGALANCAEMILVVSGERKRGLVEAALAGSRDLPVGRLLAALAAPLTIYWTPA